jgi:hypothetical protein
VCIIGTAFYYTILLYDVPNDDILAISVSALVIFLSADWLFVQTIPDDTRKIYQNDIVVYM